MKIRVTIYLVAIIAILISPAAAVDAGKTTGTVPIAELTTKAEKGGDRIAASQDLPGIEYRKIDENTILITKGLNYIRRAVTEEFRQSFSPVFIIMVIDNTFLTKSGGMFRPRMTLSEEENQKYLRQSKARGDTLDVRGVYDSIGMKWVFVNPKMSFTVKNMVFETLSKDATIEFKEEGVLLQRFEIKPR